MRLRRFVGWSFLGCFLGCCFALDLSHGVRVQFMVASAQSFYGRYNENGSITPKPTLSSAGNCKAQVTLSWDVSSIEDANRAFWELKIGANFTNPTGRESNRAAKGSGDVTGSKTLDLRKYGPYLTGQTYYFRVVAKEGYQDLAARSEAEIHTAPPIEASVNLSQTDSQVVMAWNLTGDQQPCSDASFYEVYDQPFTSAGKQNGRLYHGKVSGSSGSRTFDLYEEHGPGTYYFRVVGKYQGGQPKKDIGTRAQPGATLIFNPVLNSGE